MVVLIITNSYRVFLPPSSPISSLRLIIDQKDQVSCSLKSPPWLVLDLKYFRYPLLSTSQTCPHVRSILWRVFPVLETSSKVNFWSETQRILQSLLNFWVSRFIFWGPSIIKHLVKKKKFNSDLKSELDRPSVLRDYGLLDAHDLWYLDVINTHTWRNPLGSFSLRISRQNSIIPVVWRSFMVQWVIWSRTTWELDLRKNC